MRYLSTRGKAQEERFLGILLSGLASDGGLYLPAHYPQVTAAELATWRGLDYAALASSILRKFIDDIPAAEIDALCRRTYTAQIYCNARDPADAAAITPLRWLEPGLALLELSNGPTLAFKDMAMQLLGGLFEYALAKEGRHLNILGATSGDTGAAAEYALRGKAGVNVFMLSPHGRMSAFQRAQMYSLADRNIFNLAIEGTFDDCQDIVKQLAGDLEFKQRMHLGAVNSINWARVVAQVVYYFRGYFAATRDEGEKVSFAVPSGNFGNVLAGWIAKQMGLPVEQLVLATNENNVLDEFFRTGRYRVRSAAQATSSPSMDISKASNFERFIFDIVGRDPAAVGELWWQIDTEGEFDLARTPFWANVEQTGFVSGTSTHAARLATIRQLHAATGLVIDPHTADGVKVAREHRRAGVPMVCLETAQPAKFAATIVEAIGHAPPLPAAFAQLEAQPQRFEVMPADAHRVKQYVTDHASWPGGQHGRA
jgi:threonine synthase